MSKKFGKFLLFSALAGAAVYGAYQYLQTKDQTASPANADDADDDLDDFNEDLDEEPTAEPERSYVSLNLDKAAAIASESFHKAKEVIADSVQQVRDTVKSVTEGQISSETIFTDLTALKKESESAKTEPAEPEIPVSPSPAESEDLSEVDVRSATPTETFYEDAHNEAQSDNPVSSEMVEDFYDDTL